MSEHDHQAVHQKFGGNGGSPLRSRRLRVVVGLWAVSLLVTGWFVLGDRRVGDPSVVKGVAAVAPLLATNAALLRWSAPVRVDELRAASTTRRLPTTLTVAAAVLVLFPLGITGLAVLVPVAAAAGGGPRRPAAQPTDGTRVGVGAGPGPPPTSPSAVSGSCETRSEITDRLDARGRGRYG